MRNCDVWVAERGGERLLPRAFSLTPRAWRSFETSHRAVESKSAVEQGEFELLPRLQALDLSICEFGRFGRRSCLHEATQSLFLAMRTSNHVELALL